MNHSSMKIEQIKKIDKHEGFVKGISWDPAGKYLASQVSFFHFFIIIWTHRLYVV